MTRNFVDFHSHLLPNLDDGACDLRESLEMARVLAGFGFTLVHCTPHLIKGGFDNPPDRVRQVTKSLQQAFDREGIELRLAPGTEHYLDEYFLEQVPGALTVGSRHILVEAPFRGGEGILPVMTAGLKKHGLTPLIAHPERCGAFQLPTGDEGKRGMLSFVFGRQKERDKAPLILAKLRESGCRFQGNLGSFAGVYGGEVKQRALRFLREGVYSCLGSDAHHSDDLEAILSEGLDAVVATVGEVAAFELMRGGVIMGATP